MTDLNQFRQKLCRFENFFIFIGTLDWCSEINEQSVKDLFKRAHLLEVFCAKLEENKLTEEFSLYLKDYFKIQGHLSCPGLDFFQNACDVLLKKFFSDSRINDVVLKFSCYQYCNYCGENRFGIIVKQFVDAARAFLVLRDVVEDECDPVHTEARLIYESFYERLYFASKDLKSMDESIIEMLNCNVKSINIILHILCFKDDNAICKIIKDCIVSKLTSNSSVARIQVWKCFLELPSEKVIFIIKNYPNILDSLFEIVTNMSKRFHCVYIENEFKFVTNDNDMMKFVDILKLLNIIYNIDETHKKRVDNYINSKKSSPQYLFFEDINNKFT